MPPSARHTRDDYYRGGLAAYGRLRFALTRSALSGDRFDIIDAAKKAAEASLGDRARPRRRGFFAYRRPLVKASVASLREAYFDCAQLAYCSPFHLASSPS